MTFAPKPVGTIEHMKMAAVSRLTDFSFDWYSPFAPVSKKSHQSCTTQSLMEKTCSLSARDLLFVVRLRLMFGVRRWGCQRTFRLLCSAFGDFSLLTPFRLRPLLFLTLELLLTLLEGDAHVPPQKSCSILPLLRVLAHQRGSRGWRANSR